MTDNSNALAIAPSMDNALANIKEPELQRMAVLAKRAVVVGTGEQRRGVNDQEAASLALISMATGASFVNGELFLTTTGPQFGIPLYERKADEYMWALLPGSSYHIAYRDAVPNVDAVFDPGRGDVAFVAVLTRDDWEATWKKNYSEYFLLLVNAQAPWAEANKFALEMAGHKPTLEFVGVCDGRESFSGDEYEWDEKTRQKIKTGEKKPEMFDRIERAKKRARKGVLKHAFPRLNIPDVAALLAKPEAARLIEVTSRDAPPSPPSVAAPSRQAQLMRDLGIEDGPEPTPPNASRETIKQEIVEILENFTEGTLYSSDVIERLIALNLGIKDPKWMQEILCASHIISPAVKFDWLKKYISFYASARKAGKDDPDAVQDADGKVANLMSDTP